MKHPHEELAESAVADISGQIPGVTVAVKVIQLAIRHQAEKRASEFFTRLSVAIGAKDGEEAARVVAESIDEEWASEAVERGYHAMMNTMVPEARQAIAVLVAEYLTNKRLPDTPYQRVGSLLARAALDELQVLARVSQASKVLLDRSPNAAGMRVVIQGNRPEDRDQCWTMVFDAVTKTWLRGDVLPSSAPLRRALTCLSREGLARSWSGLSDAAFEGNPVVYFNREDDKAISLLATCLTMLSRDPEETRE